MPRETRGTISNAKNPSLWRRSGLFWCAVTSRSDEGYYLWKSADFGRSWTQVTMATIWNPEEYHRAASCGLLGRGAASVANKRNTAPVEIYCKVTRNESDWITDVTPVLVGTYSGSAKQFSIRQKQEAGHIHLIVTNAVDAAWISKNLGRTWASY